MKPLFALLSFPAFVLAGQIAGTVSHLNGDPIAGVVVATSTESDVSNSSGSWSLGRVAGVRAKSGPTKDAPSYIVIQNSRPLLSWNGYGLDGRRRFGGNPTTSGEVASRTAKVASPETLWVYWKGKRLAQVPLETTDTSGVAIRVDTAWSDDFGVPWNFRVAYGSLRDARDGHVYRTVKIGAQTWMAENLAYSGGFAGMDSIGGCSAIVDTCRKFGRQYRWNQVVDSSGLDSIWPNPLVRIRQYHNIIARDTSIRQGVCPQGWVMPREAEWFELARFVAPRDTIEYEGFVWTLGGMTKSDVFFRALKSQTGWPGERGADPFGFRALQTGIGEGLVWSWWADPIAGFWSSNNLRASGRGSPDPLSILAIGEGEGGEYWGALYSLESGAWNSVRCVQAISAMERSE